METKLTVLFVGAFMIGLLTLMLIWVFLKAVYDCEKILDDIRKLVNRDRN